MIKSKIDIWAFKSEGMHYSHHLFLLRGGRKGNVSASCCPQGQKATKSWLLHHLKHSVNSWRCFYYSASEASTGFVKHLEKRSQVEIAPFMDLGYCSAPFHLIWCIIRCYLYKRSFMSREAVLSRLIWVFPTYINAFPSTSPATWDVYYFKHCHFIQRWSSFVVALWWNLGNLAVANFTQQLCCIPGRFRWG